MAVFYLCFVYSREVIVSDNPNYLIIFFETTQKFYSTFLSVERFLIQACAAAYPVLLTSTRNVFIAQTSYLIATLVYVLKDFLSTFPR